MLENLSDQALFKDKLQSARLALLSKIIDKDHLLAKHQFSENAEPEKAKHFFDKIDEVYGRFYEEQNTAALLRPTEVVRSQVIDSFTETVWNKLSKLTHRTNDMYAFYDLKKHYLSNFDVRFSEGQDFSNQFKQTKKTLEQ